MRQRGMDYATRRSGNGREDMAPFAAATHQDFSRACAEAQEGDLRDDEFVTTRPLLHMRDAGTF